MTKLEKYPCIVLTYDWKLPTTEDGNEAGLILSNKIKYQKYDSFQAGRKKVPGSDFESDYDLIIFMTHNLNKMGLRAMGVSYSIIGKDDAKKIEMKLKTSGREEEENGAIQLFAAPPYRLPTNNKCLSFTVYLSSGDGIVENYKIHQLDGLLSQQLWSSAMNQYGTDFKLIANDGKTFPVHKFILSARSTVFDVLFKEDHEFNAISSLNIMDFKGKELEQFIRFIYIGELDGPVSDELIKLAEKYQIKTLGNLFKATSLEEISVDKLARLALHLQPGTHYMTPSEEKIPPESDMTIKYEGNNTSIIKVRWSVDHWTEHWTEFTKGSTADYKRASKTTSIVTSEAFEHGGTKLFRAELEMIESSDASKESPITVSLKFISHGHQNISCEVEEVTILNINQNNIGYCKMKEAQTRNKKLFQVFTVPKHQLSITSLFCCPFVVTFHIKLRSTVPNFINKLVDSTCSEQLWAAAVHGKMTDVDFLVGDVAFCAHRSILSARSPVFAAIFASGIKTASGQLSIEDVDPATFQHFLKFIYTGMVEPSSIDKELFKVADRYRVETLMELCCPATQTVDTEDIIKTFFSC